MTTKTTSLVVVVGCIFISVVTMTTNALRANSWQKRLDRAFLQVDGVSPEGRFRSFQRALKDPELRTDVTEAINVVREKGFGKGHPEFIELLWPEGTQARRDLEAINALSKQLPERISEFDNNDDDDDNRGGRSSALLDLIRSTQGQVRFGDDKNSNARTVAFSLFKRVRSEPDRYLRLAENFLRNTPVDVESPYYELLGKYSDDDGAEEEGTDDNVEDDNVEDDNDENGTTQKKKKSFLTVPPLEIRRYDAFQTVSVPLLASSTSSSSSSSSSSFDVDEKTSRYKLQNMGTALTEIFSYLELGDNTESTVMSMTTPFFIIDTTNAAAAIEEKDTNRMFVKLPTEYEVNPPNPVESSRITLDEFPETVMATLSFAGIITEDEIKRQKVKLIERIETTKDIGWKIKINGIYKTKKTNDIDVDVDNEEEKMNMKNDDEDGQHKFMFLQYNAPGTLPWRRMNEIAVVMEKKVNKIDDENKTDKIKDDIIKIDQDENSEVSASTSEKKEEKVDDEICDDNDDSNTMTTD